MFCIYIKSYSYKCIDVISSDIQVVCQLPDDKNTQCDAWYRAVPHSGLCYNHLGWWAWRDSRYGTEIWVRILNM